jgi:hypothetical protein
MAARRGVACSGVAGVFDEEADMISGCLRCVSMCWCARDTGSQGVGQAVATAGLGSAKEQLSQGRLHVSVCLVFRSQTPGVRVVDVVVLAVE